MIKRLKDYIIDSNSWEGTRPLGGAVGLLLPEEENNKPEQRDPRLGLVLVFTAFPEVSKT